MNKQLLTLIKSKIVDETKTDNVLYVFEKYEELNKFKKYCLKRNFCMVDKILMTTNDILHDKLRGYSFKRYIYMDDDKMAIIEKFM